MRMFVTGGAGFISSHLVDRLLGDGHHVTIADNLLTGHRENIAHLRGDRRIRFVHQDISEPLAPELAETPFERICNLASPASPRGYLRYPLETMRVNSTGVWNVLALAARHGARVVQASTSEVYGDPLVHPQVEGYWGNVNPVGPRACYDEGKRFAEGLVMEHVRKLGVDARIARIFITYGPRSHPADGRVIPSLYVQAIAREPIAIFGDGEQTRSFCYVADMVRGLVALMEADGLTGEVVNLGNPDERTVLELAERIAHLAGSDAGIRFEPLPQDDPRQRRPDISRAGAARLVARDRPGRRPSLHARVLPRACRLAGPHRGRHRLSVAAPRRPGGDPAESVTAYWEQSRGQLSSNSCSVARVCVRW